MMLLAGLPFITYKLTGKAKEDMHNELIRYREALKIEQATADTTDADTETNIPWEE